MPEGKTRPALIVLTPAIWKDLHEEIVEIEQQSFPPSLQDSADDLREIVCSPTGIFLAARVSPQPRTVGYVAADLLEHFPTIPGVTSDPHFKKGYTIYIESVAVHPHWRGRGIGSDLIRECLRLASMKGFARTTAHVATGTATKLRSDVRVLASFENWYRTGRRFDYVEFSLK